MTVHYDAWGRVVETYSGSSSVAGPNGAASYTTYSYDALGRQITTNNYTNTDTLISGTQTYFDGANPIEVRMQDNTPAGDERLVAGRWTIDPPRRGGRGVEHVHGLDHHAQQRGRDSASLSDDRRHRQHRGRGRSDGDGAGAVHVHGGRASAGAHRRTGRPAARAGGIVQYASTLGWNWLYRGQQWVQTQPDTSSAQWRGLYVGGSGQWYDPVHATTLQPNLSGYGDPQTNPYQMTFQEQFGATVAPMAIGIGVGIIAGIATGGLGLAFMPGIMAGAAGGAASMGSSTYVAGGDFGQIAESAAIGASRRRGGRRGGRACGVAGSWGTECGRRQLCRGRDGARRAAAAFAIGASEGGAFGAAEGFTRTALMGGSAVDAVMAGWNGLVGGIELGGPLGAIFHQVCFVAGTQVLARPADDARDGPKIPFGPERAGISVDSLHRRTVAGPAYRLLTLSMTAHHPLYVVGKGWTPVCEVKPGESASGG